MSKKHFGTDGIRGVANQKLTPELAFALGQATGRWMRERNLVLRAAIGRDTRRSGPMLGAALGAGLNSAGVDVVALGVAPTPAIAYVARTGHFGLGAIISASHNPAPDNGIKLVGHDGKKLPDEEEIAIEALMGEAFESRPEGAGVGVLTTDRKDLEGYVEHLKRILPDGLEGMHIAVDAAHGAAYELAPTVLENLGARVSVMGVRPDGMNINEEGGATKPQAIQTFTVQSGADLGVAFDGDADRAVFSDDRGQLINGDRTIGLWAAHEAEQGRLDPPVVVGTVMSNGGFEAYLASRGVRLERAPVGDKYVAERIAATGARIGGEQSGHLIFPHLGPTGDGLATMLEVLRVLRAQGGPSSAFSQAFSNWPQLLVNLNTPHAKTWDRGPKVQEAVREAEAKLSGRGRVNVRASGTQPLVRVMVEADDEALRDEVAEKIVAAMAEEVEATEYSRVDLTHALGD